MSRHPASKSPAPPKASAVLRAITTAKPDYYHVEEGSTLSIGAAAGLLINDYTNSGTVSVASFTDPAHGSLSVASDGSFTYVPDAGFSGTDTFTYAATDGLVGTAATSTTTVTLEVYQPALVAVTDTYTVPAGGTLTESAAGGLLANDLSTNGSLEAIAFSSPSHGSLDLSLTGAITYTPDAGFVGTDSFTYYISNGIGTTSVADSIVVTDATAQNDNYSMRAGGTLIVSGTNGLLANDKNTGGTLSSGQPAHGSLNLSASGNFTYTPNPGFTGTDSFVYYISDGAETSSATAYINVVDRAPVANNDHYTTDENTTLSISGAHGLLANDYDPDGDTITTEAFSSPAHGSLDVSLTGAFTYTPDAGFSGTDTFTYYIDDGEVTTAATATVTTELRTRATIVTANPDEYVVIEDGSLVVAGSLGLLANDYANHGSISPNSFTDPAHGSLDLGSDGGFTYVPDAGFAGKDGFTYFITDGSLTSSSTVALDVYQPALIAVTDTYTVLAGGTLTESAAGGLLANDLSTNGSLEAIAFSSPAHGSLDLSLTGAITYTPDAGFVGTDSFTYYISNGIGTTSVADSIVVMDAQPLAENDNYSVRAGGMLIVSGTNGLLANDKDTGGTLIASSAGQPAHGSLNLSATGGFTYTPDSGFTGTDSFIYDIADGAGTASATAYIDVLDTSPVANPDYYHMKRNTVLTISTAHGLLANDFDPDGDAITAAGYSTPAHGSLSVSSTGSFTYTPNAGFVGPDTFTYYISDGVLQSSAVAEIDVLACFAAGTKILTADGEVAVERLRVGEEVRLANGGYAAIIWIGHRTIDLTRHNRPAAAQPILISAGALDDGVPWRDLVVSPDHAMYLDGHLIPAKALTNGFTIRQLQRAQVTYYHIELHEHGVILAEGAAAESYLESGNRAAFENGGPAINLHPDFAQSLREQNGCAPFAEHDGVVPAVRERILARARIETDCEPDIHILYRDGEAIITSRAAIPAEISADPRDRRMLGVKIAALKIGGRDVPVDHPGLRAGWHEIEADGRWTDGRAVIPANLLNGATNVQVRLAATLMYPVAWRGTALAA